MSGATRSFGLSCHGIMASWHPKPDNVLYDWIGRHSKTRAKPSNRHPTPFGQQLGGRSRPSRSMAQLIIGMDGADVGLIGGEEGMMWLDGLYLGCFEG